MKYEETLKCLCRQPKLTAEQILIMFKNKNFIDVNVIQKDIGKLGFEITADDEGIFFVTERPISYYNKMCGRATLTQKLIINFSIPLPLFIGQGTLSKDIFEIINSGNPEEMANKWLHKIFTVETAIAYFNKYLSVSDSFKEYKAIIFEAIEAYYIGMDHVAIMALLPVFEAGLRNIQYKILGNSLNNVSTKEFDERIKQLILYQGKGKISKYNWYIGKGYNSELEIDFLTHISPQCDVINCLRIFFKEVLYKPSDVNTKGFNRHLILHLLKNDFNEPSNFVRIFLALTHIAFIESLCDTKVPFSWQGIDEKDIKISKYIRIQSTQFGTRRKLLDDLGICSYKP